MSNLIFRGYNLAVGTLSRNLQKFLDILEFRIENKKFFIGKTILKMWAQICGEKKIYESTKVLLEKVQKLKTTKK